MDVRKGRDTVCNPAQIHITSSQRAIPTAEIPVVDGWVEGRTGPYDIAEGIPR